MAKRVKNQEQYDALRDQGYSKEKSARIANTQNSGRTKEDLYEQAKKVGIEGRSKMTKKELIKALRNN